MKVNGRVLTYDERAREELKKRREEPILFREQSTAAAPAAEKENLTSRADAGKEEEIFKRETRAFDLFRVGFREANMREPLKRNPNTVRKIRENRPFGIN